MASASSAYATLFEEDYVAWLLGRPDDTLAALAEAVGLAPNTLSEHLRRHAWSHFTHRSKQQDRRRLFFTSQQAGNQSSHACAPSTSLRRASLRTLCILANEYGVPAIARFSGSECAGHAPSQRYVYCTHSSQALRAHFTTKEPTHNHNTPTTNVTQVSMYGAAINNKALWAFIALLFLCESRAT